MKNIIVGIDFSDASFNAISYAAYLANAFNTQLTLVHAYTNTPSLGKPLDGKVFGSSEASEAADEDFLRKEIEGIVRRFTIKINSIVMKGKPVKVISEVAEKIHSEMIVMGMKGVGESNSILGSTTISMIDETSIPLLIIPGKAFYHTIKTITLASDFKNEKLLSDFTILEKLIEKFNPFIEILNVQRKESKLTAETIAGKISKKLTWDKHDYSFNITEKDNVEEGINKFLSKCETDLLVMIARKRNFINQIFQPSHTKRMTNQIKIPLLVLHF